MSKGRGAAMGIVLAIMILLALVNVGNVYAQTITVMPSSVTQGNNFQVSGTGFADLVGGTVEVWANAGCTGPPLLTTLVTSNAFGDIAPVTFSSAGLVVGTNCIEINVAFTATGSVTVTAAPAAPSSYVPPVTIGGTLLPINRLQVVLPWLALITLLGTISVWTLVIKRERRTD